MNKVELLQKISVLAAECRELACDLDIGDERTEMFELYVVLRRVQFHGAAGEMLAATNPLLCHGIGSDVEWVGFDEEDDD
ncbi:hypothetical protein JHU04_002455 [Brenneria sp. 4F2]|nr:hypothetical protein [Brenneria bubanii]